MAAGILVEAIENLLSAAVVVVGSRLVETLYTMKMADEQAVAVAVAAAAPRTCQTGWVVVVPPLAEMQ